MRRRFLVRSVASALPTGERVIRVAFLWNRHRLMPVFTLGALASLTAVATIAGFETWTTRLAIGVAGAAVAGTATSDYWVLAQTSTGLVWLKGSRIRHRAVRLLTRLPVHTTMTRQGGTMLASEWMIADASYSATRSYDLDLQAIADSLTPRRSS